MTPRLLAHLPSLFIGFVAVGVAVILVFSSAFRGTPGGAWHWIMSGLVVGLMLVYGVVLWLRSRTEHGDEDDGETFYYLGFIYTLATLVATFAPLLNSSQRPDVRQVLGLFGLGLSTTFVGLAGRIVFTQALPRGDGNLEHHAIRLGDAYEDAARAIERSTVRIVHAQQRAEGHLNESYSGAIDAIRSLAGHVTQQFDSMSTEVLKTFADLHSRASRDLDTAARQVVKTHELAKEQIEGLATGTASAVRGATQALAEEFARTARESATELTGFVRQTNSNVAAALQEFESRLSALRLPPDDAAQKLAVILTHLFERAESLQRATALVTATYGELETTLASAVVGARDGGRAFSTLAVSADAANSAVVSAKTNVELFATQMGQVGQLTSGLQKLPQEAATIGTALTTLRTSLGKANRAWADVATTTDDATKSIARAGAAFSTLEENSRAAEQSVLNWSGGVTKATINLEALTEVAERAVRLGHDAVTTQTQLAAQISGPLVEQLRKHSEAAGALANRLQEDLRASEEAVRKVHHHLIDASRFILTKVDQRR